MSFNPKDHNSALTHLDRCLIKTSVWMADYKTGTPNDNVSAIITIDTGSCHIHESLNATQAQAMIDMLNQHIDYIKEAELELLALQTKAAA